MTTRAELLAEADRLDDAADHLTGDEKYAAIRRAGDLRRQARATRPAAPVKYVRGLSA